MLRIFVRERAFRRIAQDVLSADEQILRMAGANDITAPISFGQLAEDILNPGDRRHFVRVTLDGEGNVRASGPQASHRLASLAAANGLLDVPPGANWPAGKTVKVILLN